MSKHDLQNAYSTLTTKERKLLYWVVSEGFEMWYNGDCMVGTGPISKLQEQMLRFEQGVEVLHKVLPGYQEHVSKAYRVITTSKRISKLVGAHMRFKLPLASVASDTSGCRAYLSIVDWPKPLNKVALLELKVGTILGTTEGFILQLQALSRLKDAGRYDSIQGNAKQMARWLTSYRVQKEAIAKSSSLTILNSTELTCYDGETPYSAAKCLA